MNSQISGISRRRFLASTCLAAVAGAISRRSVFAEEVVKAAPTSPYDAKWGGFVIDGKTFTALVYAGV